jgi:hypothetical protein
MKLFTSASLSAAAVAAMILVTGVASPADAAGVRFQCSDQLARQDVSVTAKFERDGARRKFSVEVEAARNSSFRAGDVLRVRVDDANGIPRLVGQIRLVRGPRDLVGDLNFDTVPQADARPFPANFPRSVGAGTEVQVGAQLACALQRR